MQLSIDEIIQMTGGKLVREGATTESFNGLAALNEASETEVSFLGNEKYYQDYLETKAGVVFVPAEVPEHPAGAAIIEVENPSFAFGEIVKFFNENIVSFRPGVHRTAYISDGVQYDRNKVSIKAGAVVEAGAIIGDGTTIGSGCVVNSGVVIGENCMLHSNVTVRERCVLGDRVVLQPGCVIGSDGFGYELVDGRYVPIDQVGIVLLEDDVEVGANSTIDRARFGKTQIGEGTKIDNLVQIGHNVKVGKHSIIVAQAGVAGSVTVGNYVTLAAQSGSAGHIKIGDKAVLTAKSGALKNLAKGIIYSGWPARPMKEDYKIKAMVNKLPKVLARLKKVEKSLEDKETE